MDQLKQISYAYCHHCNLCWTVDEEFRDGGPFMLNGIYLMPEFVSADEEKLVVTKIDQIPWMASQSGRRKQDFGPKVNFKKRKLKPGNFQGFPNFAWKIATKFDQVDVLSDFKPVELCHLEYCPERGSSIDPHLDDAWLWGERLVTVNLLSETTLTLTPVELEASNECDLCNSKTLLCDFVCHNDSFACHNDSLPGSNSNNKSHNVLPAHQDSNATVDPPAQNLTRDEISKETHFNNVAETVDKLDSSTCEWHSHINISHSISGSKSANGTFSGDISQVEIEVRIILPPRSLLVLWGCARHHWYHEIKREHVTARRLAMTFRELSSEFGEDGKQWSVGKEMLNLAHGIIDL